MRITCLLIFIYLLYGCGKSRQGNARDLDYVESLIYQVDVEDDAIKPIEQIALVDSATKGKDLSLAARLRVMDFKAQVYNNDLHDTTASGRLVDSILKLIEASDISSNKRAYAKANYFKGDIYFYKQQYNDAYAYYFKAKQIGADALDSCTASEYSFRLALVLYRQERYLDAARSFIQSFYEGGNCTLLFNNYFQMQQVLNNTGLSYYKAGLVDSAFNYYNKALQFITINSARFPERQLHNQMAKAVVMGNLADIYLQRENYSMAKRLLEQSIQINSIKGADIRDAQFSMIKLAELYKRQLQYDSMYQTLAIMAQSLDTVHNPRATMTWNRMMWDYYRHVNNPGKSFQHLQKYTLLREELDRQNNELKAINLGQQIKMLEDEYQIERLKKDNELKNVYLLIFVLSSALAATIIYLVYKNLSRTRKNMTQLQQLHDHVNEQKQKLEAALLELDKKNQQQKRIMGVVAHDLRNPVASIFMLSDMILDDREDANGRKELVTLVKSSCQHSLNLIEEILEATKLDNLKELEKFPTSVNTLVSNTVEMMRMKAAGKNQSISLHLPHTDIVTRLNAENIERVLANLVNNAIKFSDEGAEIDVKLAKTDSGALVTVRDHGVGIPEHLQNKVFDMFTEARRQGTAGEATYGLGLSICRQIVAAHDGEIWLESETGNGSTFYVQLPIMEEAH